MYEIPVTEGDRDFFAHSDARKENDGEKFTFWTLSERNEQLSPGAFRLIGMKTGEKGKRDWIEECRINR